MSKGTPHNDQLGFTGMEEEWVGEWRGMPEYVSTDREAFAQVVISFESADDIKAFNEATGLKVTPQTRGVFFPSVPPHNLEYVNES
jgi:hypothetical protein